MSTEHGLRLDALTHGDYDSLDVPDLPPPLRGTTGPVDPAPDPDAWRTDAACRQRPPDLTEPQWAALWFPEQGQNVDPAIRATCATCPVRADCLDANLTERHGYLGGMTERQRRTERARHGHAVPTSDLQRERVARWAERGYPDAQIADIVGLSIHTVRQYRREAGRARVAV